ncbi:hypothetical protein [Endozoicomonas sp.]|uniref:hypothetical protein n=1 Tax=Endozoicomonas sp. TaxID=1892382 RepID=UPI002887E211|nr:hypothetical protein [Endozoicomonas sp.]
MFGPVGGKTNVGGTNDLSEAKSSTTNSENNGESGNIFRSSSPGERDYQQGIDARSANSNVPGRVHMTQPAKVGEENETVTMPAEGSSRVKEGNTGFSVAGELSALSLQDSASTFQEEAIPDSGTGMTSEDLSDTGQLMEELSSAFSELMTGRADTSDEGEKKLSLYISNFKTIVSNALDLTLRNQVVELYQNAKYIDSWLQQHGAKELEEAGVRFDPVKLSSVNAEDSVDVSFYDYLHGLSRSGIMQCLEGCLKDLDSYLTGCDVRCDDTLLQGRAMKDGSREMMLVIRFNDLKAEKLSDVQFYLDGDSNNGDVYFAKKLDDDLLRQLFKKVKDAGGKVPEKMFSEYINPSDDKITLPSPENHPIVNTI